MIKYDDEQDDSHSQLDIAIAGVAAIVSLLLLTALEVFGAFDEGASDDLFGTQFFVRKLAHLTLDFADAGFEPLLAFVLLNIAVMLESLGFGGGEYCCHGMFFLGGG